LPYDEMPEFVSDLRKRQGVVPLALEFTILTAPRLSDALNAKWAHINRAERRWDIAHFSKTGLPFRVPLSDAAMAVLDKVEKITRDSGGAVGASEFLFPNDVTGARLSRNALLAVIKRMGRKGSRSSSVT
jgi:integrase